MTPTDALRELSREAGARVWESRTNELLPRSAHCPPRPQGGAMTAKKQRRKLTPRTARTYSRDTKTETGLKPLAK